MDEPRITINGTALSAAQAMAVRVAVTNFHAEMSNPDFAAQVGPIAEGYAARLGEVLKLMLGP